MSATAEAAFDDDTPVVWEPLPGGQNLLIRCPVRELLAEGNRGGGKSDVVLVDFAQHVGEGWGSSWRGAIFRRTQKDLDDLVAKSQQLFHRAFPRARWLKSKSDYRWVFPEGEQLALRFGENEADYWAFHGHELPFLGFEELTTWADPSFYLMMHSCCRSSRMGIPKKIRSTTNPWGAGHAWVKDRFIDKARPGQVIREPGTQWRYDEATRNVVKEQVMLERAYVHIDLRDNIHLLRAQPEYVAALEAEENPERRKAWLDGDWDIVVGGFLSGSYTRERNVVRPFDIPMHWKRWRALDWGSARPYSVGWYAQDPADGCIYRYRELYGWGGKPNVGTKEQAADVAARILALEKPEQKAGIRFERNPADPGIRSDDGRPHTIEEIFRAAGVRWIMASTGPGSRENSAQVVKERLSAGTFKIFASCQHWLRTTPILEPSETNWEDVNTDMEDHAWDETRYSITSRQPKPMPKPEPTGPKPGTFDAIARDPPRAPSKYRRR